jgi:hypothetical protein
VLPLSRPVVRRALRRGTRGEYGPFSIIVDSATRAPLWEAIEAIERAFSLIEQYDPVAARGVGRDLRTLYISDARRAGYLLDLRVCVITSTDLAAGPEHLALLLVHEAMHARIGNAGIGWWPSVEGRIEALCIKQELRLLSRLESAGYGVASLRAYLRKRRANYLGQEGSSRLSPPDQHSRSS